MKDKLYYSLKTPLQSYMNDRIVSPHLLTKFNFEIETTPSIFIVRINSTSFMFMVSLNIQLSILK